MKIFKTKLYKVDYQCTCGGGTDVIRGRILLEKYPYLIDKAEKGQITITKVF